MIVDFKKVKFALFQLTIFLSTISDDVSRGTPVAGESTIALGKKKCLKYGFQLLLFYS